MDASCDPLQKLLSRSRLSRRLSGSATTVIRIIMAMRHYTMQAGNPQHFGTIVRVTRKACVNPLQPPVLVVKFNFILSAAIGFVTAFMLTTCASPSRVVWEYYDQCARENPSFLAMAECGRQKRLAECVPNNTCSPEGNMFMQYVDTLVVSVKKKELTEAEAIRRYTEYKAGGTPSHP